MNLLATINPEKTSDQEANSYPMRKAVRAVVFDPEGKIALLHVTRDQYYKLPGGGIEQDENHEAALQRECLEEIGCRVEVLDELGMIIENRKFCNLKQISYCYFAKQVGNQNKPNFTTDEIEEGFEELWVPYKKAMALLEKNEAIGIEGRSYIVPRDTLFLKAAERFIRESTS